MASILRGDLQRRERMLTRRGSRSALVAVLGQACLYRQNPVGIVFGGSNEY
jgi:hypothetical protein